MLRISRGAPRGGRAARRWAALAAVTVGGALLGACSDDYYQETTGPERYAFGVYPYQAFGGGMPLYGCWSRVAAGGTGFIDQFSWLFRTDGTGAQTIVRKSLAGVPLGAETASFTWTPLVSGQVHIEFTGGPAGPQAFLQLPYVIETSFGAPVLHLDGFMFNRGCV